MQFPPTTIKFLKQLSKNNNRDWFQENKQRYEDEVRGPALEFIQCMASPLEKLSGCVTAEAKKVGGSLMRPYRDTRFAKDAPPIKTNVGIQFRHRMGKDVHAPGWYVHLEPGRCFLGAGVWRPDSPSLKKVRSYIDQHGKTWASIVRRSEKADWELAGDTLSRPPQGYSAEHPWIELLKRKDHILLHSFEDQRAAEKGFDKFVLQKFRSSRPFMEQLCESLGVPF